jgi:hypothetical protein
LERRTWFYLGVARGNHICDLEGRLSLKSVVQGSADWKTDGRHTRENALMRRADELKEVL